MSEAEKKFFYCNSIEIGVSPFDVNFKMMRQGTPDNAVGEVKPIKLDELTVAMSPSHAKSMLAGFYTAIKNYEDSVGKIPLPSDQQKIFDLTFPHFPK